VQIYATFKTRRGKTGEFVDFTFHLIDWLNIHGFTSRSRIFHLITGERLQHLRLRSALGAFEQGGIFIVPHLLRHGASVFPVSSEAGVPLEL
jgi:hypothetical protein